MCYERVLDESLLPAYERLKSGLLRLIDEGKISLEDAARVLPELRESEDERIRKALIDALKVSETIGELKFRLPYPTREECIAYLEKQKESLHVQETCKENADSFTSEDERIRKEIIDFLETIPASELKRIPRPISEWFAWLEKQKEHHIPWYDYQKSKEAGYTIVPNEEYEQLIKQKEQKPQVFCEAKAYDLGYKQGKEDATKEQKPAEWSEEDERIRKAILGFLNPDKGGTKYSSNAELVEWSDWLKSLRPSWKPSEEQMNCLCAAVDAAIRKHNESVGGYEPARVLKSLYEDLKKL